MAIDVCPKPPTVCLLHENLPLNSVHDKICENPIVTEEVESSHDQATANSFFEKRLNSTCLLSFLYSISGNDFFT